MSLSSPQLELSIAHVLDENKKGNFSKVLYCGGILKYCTLNPYGRKSICRACISKTENGLKILHEFRNIEILKLEELSTKNVDINKIEHEIKSELKHSVNSGIASQTRISNVKYFSKKLLIAQDNILKGAILLYYLILLYIKNNKITTAYSFNGRFSCSKSVIIAAKKSKTNYKIFDLNRGFNHYCFENVSLHSINENTSRALNLYNQNKLLAKETAQKFYRNKIDRKFTYERSYTKQQSIGLINFTFSKKLLSIYTSSDDEFRFLSNDWGGGTVVDQINEINKIYDHVKDDYDVVVRMHPNQAFINKYTYREYLTNINKNIRLIEPNDKCDTYELIKASDVVVTFCSLIGPEAFYQGKKTITIGPSPYMNLNVGINIKCGSEIFYTINKYHQFDKTGSIIWSNYLMNYSDPLLFFKKHENGIFSVNNVVIKNQAFNLSFIIAKIEIYLSKEFYINTKLLFYLLNKLKSIIDGKVRGEHLVK